ncbi:DnaJ domain-containing protein [Cardiosporidium cionae]|uniref:DnaJ domain-containing protein n=1 Tax=Cardiosporidium cionae TaxID=476202 RepID=A0ABQ7J5K7_9APIC|nr:DnaJ domain-containing protein [Cardiosporidium cionae]|eukprot:KAF8819272.1 DnaJ domain-containing protein [Cardiosporidium cionae]
MLNWLRLRYLCVLYDLPIGGSSCSTTVSPYRRFASLRFWYGFSPHAVFLCPTPRFFKYHTPALNCNARSVCLLGVAKDASKATIRSAYLKKVKLYHPDINKSRSSVAIFRQVQEAYSVLSNEGKRREYDLKLGFGKPNYDHRSMDQHDTSSSLYNQFESLRREKEAMEREFWSQRFGRGNRRSSGKMQTPEPVGNFSPFDRFRFMNSPIFSFYYTFLRVLPLLIFPSFIFFLVYRQLRIARDIQRHRPTIYYDSFGRAYVMDAYGRKRRMFEYDHINAGDW